MGDSTYRTLPNVWCKFQGVCSESHLGRNMVWRETLKRKVIKGGRTKEGVNEALVKFGVRGGTREIRRNIA